VKASVHRHPRQSGMVLMVTLVMLIVITLFVLSMVRLSNTNAIIVGNMQAQKAVEAEAQQAAELALNKFAFWEDAMTTVNTWASTSTASVSYSSIWTTYLPAGAGSTTPPKTQSDNIIVYRPQCLFFEPAAGYSALSGVAPQDTYWDLQVSASDSRTGASTEIHQGVQMRLPAGNCK
jgi:hypothetical protein